MSGPNQFFKISIDHLAAVWSSDMSNPHQHVPSSIAPAVLIETVLVALLERKKVLIYSKPGLSTSQLLLGVETAFPETSRGAQYHRPATKAPGNLPSPDLRDLDALLVNDVSLPAFENQREQMSGGKLGIMAGLSGAPSRDRALARWALFFNGAPDLIIEIAADGVFFDVTYT